MRAGFGHLDEVNRLIVEDHCRSPRNSEPITNHNAEARIDNPFCGDEVLVQLRIDGGSIADISVQAYGCAITQAAASIMGERVEQCDIDDVHQIATVIRKMLSAGELSSEEELDAVGDSIALKDVARFPVRVKCALLAWATLEDAIDTFEG